MWNRKKEEETGYDQPATTAPPQPTSASLAREGIPLQPISRAPDTRSAAAIGKAVIVKGNIYSREDLYVDGEVEGTIELKENRLTVGPNGKVNASVKAKEVVAHGVINGNIEVADRIEIKDKAKIVGDIKTSRIVIEDGAFFKGGIDIARTEAPQQQSQPRQVPAPPPVVTPPAPAPAGSANENQQARAAAASNKA